MRDEQQKSEELYLKIIEWCTEYSTLEITNALAKALGVVLGHQNISNRKSLMDHISRVISGYDELFREFRFKKLESSKAMYYTEKEVIDNVQIDCKIPTYGKCFIMTKPIVFEEEKSEQ